jgi:hypothetical protein
MFYLDYRDGRRWEPELGMPPEGSRHNGGASQLHINRVKVVNLSYVK